MVPDTILFKAGPTVPLTDRWSVDASLTYFEAVEDGLDIGGPGFSLPLLPEVEEEGFIGQIGIAYSAGEYGYWRLTYSEVFDGRNIGEEQTIGISYSFGFDL